MSQLTNQEKNGNTFLSETLGSAVPDSGASGTVCLIKWYECFLETLTNTQKKIIVKEGVSTFKFGDGNKLNSLYNVTLSCVIADIEVSVVTDVIDADIPLLLNKDSMKRAGTCLKFENDSVTMFKKKIPLRFTSLSPNLYQTKVSSNTYFSLKKSLLRTLQKKVASSKKLCDLAKNAEIRDPEFIKILEVLPNSCEVWIHYKKTEPRPIIGFTLGSYFNKNIAMDIKKNQWQQSTLPDWLCY